MSFYRWIVKRATVLLGKLTTNGENRVNAIEPSLCQCGKYDLRQVEILGLREVLEGLPTNVCNSFQWSFICGLAATSLMIILLLISYCPLQQRIFGKNKNETGASAAHLVEEKVRCDRYLGECVYYLRVSDGFRLRMGLRGRSRSSSTSPLPKG